MLTSFAEIAENYSVILFDAYGVLKSSAGAMPGIHEVLSRLRRAGKDLYVVTNDASRSPAEMALAYTDVSHGELIPADKNISSGLLASEFLRSKVRSGRVAYLGKPASTFYIELAGLEPVPIASCHGADDIRALALLDDEGFDWLQDTNRALNMIRRLNIPVVVANSDASYPVNSHDIGIAVGSLASMIEGIIKKSFIRFGKPDAMMFSYAFSKARARHPQLSKDDILFVGDTLETDIIGANKFGLDTLLVLSGNTLPGDAQTRITATGIIPTYISESVFT